MTTPLRLSERYREVTLTGKTVAFTNIREQITDLSYADAIVRPHGLNSVLRLIYHLDYYQRGLIDVLQGGPLTIRDRYSYDVPEPIDAVQWTTLRQGYLERAEIFANLIAGMSEEVVHEPFVQPQYGDYRTNLEVTIEHTYYHLGQIVLIKKIIADTST